MNTEITHPGLEAANGEALARIETGLNLPLRQRVHLSHVDLLAMAGGQPMDGSLYFGSLHIQSIDEFLGTVELSNTKALAGGSTSTNINGGGGLAPLKSESPIEFLLFDQVSAYDSVRAHFVGWKLTQASGWVAQTPNITLSTGWSLVSGVYTHSSGTNELGISGAWLLGSPSLRMTVTFTGITAGSLSVELDSSGAIGTITANGTYTFSFTPDALDSAINLIPTSSFNGSFAASGLVIEKYDFI